MSNGDGLTNFHWLESSTPNGWAWATIGIPAALAWIAAALCWFLEPRLAAEGGWLGLLAITAAL